jgi:N-glycosylase/DNA lyase
MSEIARVHLFPARDYDLDATLDSGQVFRWRRNGEGWEGIVGGRWVRLTAEANSIRAETATPIPDWRWLADFLQTEVALDQVLQSFPDDEPMRAAVIACRGLRLLRQDPWECLATFILSSTKQIIQIRQIVGLLCRDFGEPIPVPPGAEPAFAFPSAERLAGVAETHLRACKMGFRAPYLLGTAQAIAHGGLDLQRLYKLPVAEARTQLTTLPGVGTKIADCVLLFAYGFPTAFPVDVWVMRALRQLYFPRRRVRLSRLRGFADTHFGPNGGYAQQYLFHYVRNYARFSRSPLHTR